MAKTKAQKKAEADAALQAAQVASQKTIGPPAQLQKPHQEGGYLFSNAIGDPSEFGAATMQIFKAPLQQHAAGEQGPGGLGDYAWAPAGGGQATYSDGDQWLPGSWGPQTIASIQAAMDAAGFLQGQWVSGAWNNESASAFESLLAAANAEGATWQDVLNRAVADPHNAAANQKQGREPLRVQLTNPDDIRGVIQSGAQQVYGKYIDPADVDKFISAYQAQETQQQTDYYNAGAPGAAGGVFTPPAQSNAGINEQFTRQFQTQHPVEAGAGVFMDKLGKIISDLQGQPSGIRA